MFNPLYFKPDTNPSNVPNFQNVYKTCQYCYSIFIIEENRFFSRTRNETIDFVWTWCFGTDKHFGYDKSKILVKIRLFVENRRFRVENSAFLSRKFVSGLIKSGFCTIWFVYVRHIH